VTIAVVAASASHSRRSIVLEARHSESAAKVKAPTDIVKASEVQAEKAQAVVDLVLPGEARNGSRRN